jgi:4-hydroxyacetophenone monooxygenase
MSLNAPLPAAPADEPDVLAAAVAVANIPTLVMTLVQMTGDLHWIEEPYTLARTRGMADNDSGGLTDALQTEVRAAALVAIRAWKAGVPLAIAEPSHALMVRMLGHSMGDTVPEEYGEVLAHELAAGIGPSPAAPVAVPEGLDVVIVGAGVSGIAAAIKLQGLGIPFTILEKHDNVGGTWFENTYPGAGVDTPSHLYSYSFAPSDWSQYFAARNEIQSYLEKVADDFGVRQHITFGTEVVSAAYDEATQRWLVRTATDGGSEQTLSAAVVLSCVGAFNPPVIPAIPGLETFQGDWFHTARWPAGLTLDGKKVVIVGNGASAMQVVPAIASQVAELTVFQRSPQWVQPFEKFQQKVPPAMRLLFQEVPLFRAWYRLRLSWIFHDKLYGALQRDPDWADKTTAINAANDGHRAFFTNYIRSQLPGREDLCEQVTPDYPPFGKRMLMDNGWFKTLGLPQVHLVADRVAEVTPDGVVSGAGDYYLADVLVLATGFDVVRFVSSFEVMGRSGRTLRDAWEDDNCRAYLGLAVPDFPNFFTLYGPNTQTGHGGSLIYTVEAQLDYLASLLSQMVEKDVAVVECRSDVYEAYTEQVDAQHERMIWTHPAMSTYYRNDRGRVVAISPFRNVDYWRMTRHGDLNDYDLELRSTAVAKRSVASRTA